MGSTYPERFVAPRGGLSTASLHPWQNTATRSLRAAAARQGNPEFLSLWAGRGAARTRGLPAAQLLAELASEAGFVGASSPEGGFP